MESIKFSEGLVRQAGYEEAKCKFTKLEDGKSLYLVEDIEIGNNMYVVTPNVSEAIKRAERATLGVIDNNGNTAIPTVNSDIVSINDMYIAVGNKKENPSNPEDIKSIKSKIERELSGEIDFIIIDEETEYDIYKVESGKLSLVIENVSFVIENEGNLFAHTDKKDDRLVNFYEKEKKGTNVIDEEKPQMPVETFAKVNEKVVDNLKVTDMEEQKEGAPELKEDIELSENDIEFEAEKENKTSEEENNNTDEKIEEDKKSDYFQFSDIKNISSIFEQPERQNEEKVEDKVNTEEPESKEKLEDNEELEIKSQMADITSLINAGRDKVKELSTETEEYKKEIEGLKEKINNLENENSAINDTVLKQRGVIDELKSVKEKLTDENGRLSKDKKKLEDENTTLNNENKELKIKVSSLESSMKDVYGAIYDAFSDIREPEKELKKVA